MTSNIKSFDKLQQIEHGELTSEKLQQRLLKVAVACSNKTTTTYLQGFMQDNIIASHTCFGGHMDINC